MNTFLWIKIFLAISAGIVVTEAGFKIFSDCKLSGIAYDEQLGWRLKKNYEMEMKDERNPEKSKRRVSFNSRGFRDKDHLVEKDGITKSVMFLGDSYTAGTAYSNDEIFTSVFDRMLNAKTGGLVKYEVMNVSVPAWSTDQQYLFLKREGMRYHPDYIFLIIAPNDIRETYGKKFFSIRDGHLEEKGASSIPSKTRLYWALANYFCVFQYLQSKLKKQYGSFSNVFQYFPISFRVGEEMCNDKHLFLKEVPDEIIAARELFKAILLEINRLCKNNHCKLLLTIIPTKIEYDGSLKEERYQPGKIAQYIKAIAEKETIPFLDLGFNLEAEEDDPLKIFIAAEYHLNEYGHAFVAKKLLPFFTRNQ